MTVLSNCVYGSHSFPTGSTSIQIYVVEGGERTPIKKYSTGMATVIPAENNGIVDFGKWYRTTYQFQDGQILLVENRSKFKGNFLYTAAQFILVDSSAGMLDLKSIAIPNGDAVFHEVPAFQGPAYLISAQQARELGVVVKDSYERMMLDEEEVEEAFVADKAKGDLFAKTESVTTPDGEKRAFVATSKETRRVKVKRKKAEGA